MAINLGTFSCRACHIHVQRSKRGMNIYSSEPCVQCTNHVSIPRTRANQGLRIVVYTRQKAEITRVDSLWTNDTRIFQCWWQLMRWNEDGRTRPPGTMMLQACKAAFLQPSVESVSSMNRRGTESLVKSQAIRIRSGKHTLSMTHAFALVAFCKLHNHWLPSLEQYNVLSAMCYKVS